MKIGVDVRCLVEGRRTGVEEYTLNLLKNLFAIDTKNDYVLFLNSFRTPLANLQWIEKYSNVSLKHFRFPNKLLNFLFWYLEWPKIDKMLGGADVVFFPNIIFGAVSRDAKLILTIHDLSFERHLETFSLKRKMWHAFINTKKLCQKSVKIIPVSFSTKNDLEAVYGIREVKMKVIHSGIGEKFRVIDRNDPELIAIKEKYKLPYKFVLFFGTIEPRKNLIGVIRAFNQLQNEALKNNLEEIQKFSLVLAGQKGWLAGEIYAEIKRSKYKNKIIVLSGVSDEDKEYIFNLASLFVYPSFFEGFGFPPLEAMACGVPTIISNGSSLPEVVGAGALMVDPDKPQEIYQAMKEVLTSPELAEKLRAAGQAAAKKFSWEKTAREFLKILTTL